MTTAVSMFNSPESAYTGCRDLKNKTVKVVYDDKRIHDEETTYIFNPDGSGSSVSHAWGTKTELPAGTFSDILLTLPQTDKLNSKQSQMLASAYRDSLKEAN